MARCEDYDTEPGVVYHAHDLGSVACTEVAIVGWGNPPRWVCQRHYEQRLRETRARIDGMLKELRG